MRNFCILSVAFLCLALAAPVGGSVAPSMASETGEAQVRDNAGSSANIRAFDEAWLKVRDAFYDPNFRGLDWNAVGRKYRALAASQDANVAELVNQMLAELHASHAGYYTPNEIAYYDLADIFSNGLRRELEKRFAKGEVVYSGIGIMTRDIDGRHFISGVFPGHPAAEAGLLIGDEIIAADGKPFTPIGSFADKAGRKVTLTIRRDAEGDEIAVPVVPRLIRPNQAFLKAMQDGARIIEKGNRKLGYVHVWSYARAQYQRLLEELLTQGRLKNADGLIWDLRDGWGGAEPEYLDIFMRAARP